MKKKIISGLTAAGLSLALLVGIGVGTEGAKVQAAGELEAVATASTYDIVNDSSYKAYTTNDWILTFGGNNQSGGTNSKSRSKCNLSSYAAYADGTNVTTSNTAFAIANVVALSNVEQITVSYTNGSNFANGTLYLNSSTDNTTFSPVELTEGTQGMSIGSTNTVYTMTFAAQTSPTYFAVIVKDTGTTGNFRFDSMTVTFYGAGSTAVLETVSLTGDMNKKVYGLNQNWNPEGLVMTLGYDDGSTKDIVDVETLSTSLTFNPATANDLSLTTVEVTATYEGIVSTPLTVTGIEVLNYVIDHLTADLFPATGTNYTNFEGVSVTSYANYAGNSAKNSSGNIQLRTTNSNAGIITTKSGGTAQIVEVAWGTNTSSGRTLEIYGSNTAYTGNDASVLYSASTQGTLLGTIVYGTSTSLEISGGYEYIGIKSSSGALYLEYIDIYWAGSARVATGIELNGEMTNTVYEVGNAWDPTGLSVVQLYDDGTNEVIESNYTLTYDPVAPELGVTQVTVVATYNDFTSEPLVFNVTVIPALVSVYSHTFAKTDFAVEDALAADGSTTISNVLVKYAQNKLTDTNGTSTQYFYPDFVGSEFVQETRVPNVGNLDSNRGLQFGASTAPMAELKLTSGLFVANEGVTNDYLIQRIVVNAATASANSNNATLAVYIDGVEVGSTELTSASTDYAFTLAEAKAGHIEIVLANTGTTSSTQGALYLKDIEVFGRADDVTMGQVMHVAKELEALDTCSTTVEEWNTFLATTEASIDMTYGEILTVRESELSTITLYEKQSMATGDTVRDNEINALTKYNYLLGRLSESGAGASISETFNDSTFIVITAILLITTVSISLTLVIYQRKRKEEK